MRIVLMLIAMTVAGQAMTAPAPQLPWKLVSHRPHDESAFTQGLTVDGDRLVEGTGLHGRSAVRISHLGSGRLLFERRLADEEFGEGVTVLGNRIYQLTWQNGIVHVYDRRLQPLGNRRIDGEGWGLTTDGGQRLIRSDGSSWLRFHDPQTLEELGHVEVVDDGKPIDRLNELEFADGHVYANVWQTDRIAIIDPVSGTVRAWLDLSMLAARDRYPRLRYGDDAVLNGIAALPPPGRLLVTGKLWSKVYEIEVDLRTLGAR